MGKEYDAIEAARYIELHPDVRFVLASDYDALRAEIADLHESIKIVRKLASEDAVSLSEKLAAAKATLHAVIKSLDPGRPCPCDCVGAIGPECECSNSGDLRDAEAWYTQWALHNNARAIAEGRNIEALEAKLDERSDLTGCPTCPECGHEEEETWDEHSHEGMFETYTCAGCGKDFQCAQFVEITFENKKIETKPKARTLYACQSCGEEFGDGEETMDGRCPHCNKGIGDPIGTIEEDQSNG